MTNIAKAYLYVSENHFVQNQMFLKLRVEQCSKIISWEKTNGQID